MSKSLAVAMLMMRLNEEMLWRSNMKAKMVIVQAVKMAGKIECFSNLIFDLIFIFLLFRVIRFFAKNKFVVK